MLKTTQDAIDALKRPETTRDEKQIAVYLLLAGNLPEANVPEARRLLIDVASQDEAREVRTQALTNLVPLLHRDPKLTEQDHWMLGTLLDIVEKERTTETLLKSPEEKALSNKIQIATFGAAIHLMEELPSAVTPNQRQYVHQFVEQQNPDTFTECFAYDFYPSIAALRARLMMDIVLDKDLGFFSRLLEENGIKNADPELTITRGIVFRAELNKYRSKDHRPLPEMSSAPSDFGFN